MTTSHGRIAHVSDTARWVAVYRAMETDRADAHFRDPHARRLAGETGEAIVRAIPGGRRMAWSMIVRTQVFDEIILEKITRERVDLVINLAAGLDARPWRMDLPPTLRWVDVDFPAMIEYKTGILRDEKPRCRYEGVSADLSEDAGRLALFARIAAGAQRVLVVSEGLLIYLSPEQVGRLASDVAAIPNAQWWLIDLASSRLLKWMNRRWGKQVAEGTARFRFAPENGTAYFEPFGWKEDRYVSSMDAAARLKREMRGMWFWRIVMKFYPGRVREQFRRFAGTVLLKRG